MLQIKELELNQNDYSKKAMIYSDTECVPKAALLYFHGGGLLYGDKADLPDYHITRMTQAGYAIISYDYPLSPAAKLPLIMEDICSSINHYVENCTKYTDLSLPYFLWGRSAGAYLCLIAAPVSASCLTAVPEELHTTGDLETHYSVYVYARQNGCWKDLIYEGREKFFLLDYSLRTCDKLPCPLFCAHSMGDTDVPYEEFLELCRKYNAKRYIASCNEHDFDRNTEIPATRSLLDSSIVFLEQCTSNSISHARES